jgi:hypothetical protein
MRIHNSTTLGITISYYRAVLGIQDVYPGSEFFPSRIPNPGSASKNASILTLKKLFLSSQKYCLIWGLFIPDLDPGPDFLPIPDPGFKKAPDPEYGSGFLPIPDPGSRGQKGAGFQIPDPQHCYRACVHKDGTCEVGSLVSLSVLSRARSSASFLAL